jgi:hypothetical protein
VGRSFADLHQQPRKRLDPVSSGLESGPFQVLDDCKPGVDDCGCIASNRLDAVPIAFRYLPGHRPWRSAPGVDFSN